MPIKAFRAPLLVAVASMALVLAGCSSNGETSTNGDSEGQFAKDENTLVMGMVPDQQSVESNFQPLIEYIEAITGRTVELVESADYAALVEAAIAGRIDIGTFSGFTYVAATNGGAQLEPIGVTITIEGEEPGYESLAIVPAGSDITSIEDMAGHNICFVDPGSTSGYLYPSSALLAAGIDPVNDINPVFAGGHDVSAQYVAQGTQCDAGFAEDAVVYITGIEQGLFEEGDLVVIDAQVVPGAPLVISTLLPREIQDELREGLRNITLEDIAGQGIEITSAFEAYFYELVPVEDSYYDAVRQVCEQTGAPQCQP